MGAIPFVLWAFSCLSLVQCSTFKITSALVTTNIPQTTTTTSTQTTTTPAMATTTRPSLASQSASQNWFGPSVIMSLDPDNSPPPGTSESSSSVDDDSLVEPRADGQVDPMETDMCIWNEDLAWRYGHRWQILPCNQTCRCASRSEPKDPLRDVYVYLTKNLKPNSFQTEIRCGLAPTYCESHTQSEPEAYRLKSFMVNPVNSSTLEIKLTLPDFALGQSGRIELNYTSVAPTVAEFQADEPPANATWFSRTKIRTPDGLFSKRLIVHFLTDLKPNHKYWLKTLVRFDGEPFATPIESPPQSIVMPQPMVKLLPNKVRVHTAWTTQRPTTTTTSLESETAPTFVTTTTAASTTTQTAASSTTSSTTTQTPDSATTSTFLTTPAPASSTTDTISATTRISTTKPPQELQNHIHLEGDTTNIKKPDVGQMMDEEPCKNATYYNGLRLASRLAEPIEESLRVFISEWIQNAPVERYAWHLLVALVTMTVLFLIVSYLYCKKSRVIAPITSPHYPYHHEHHHHHQNQQQSAYDNPTFTKLLSFYQPHVLLVNESNQNMDNQAKQKNIEVDELSLLSNQILKGHEKRSNREETKN